MRNEIEMLQGIFSGWADGAWTDGAADGCLYGGHSGWRKEIIESILKQSFSRIPVYDGDKDNVIGLIHTKRLLNGKDSSMVWQYRSAQDPAGAALCTGNHVCRWFAQGAAQ